MYLKEKKESLSTKIFSMPRIGTILSKFENEQLTKIHKIRESRPEFKMNEFNVGDTINVIYRMSDDDHTRKQIFSGVVIARFSKGIRSSFIVRKPSVKRGLYLERKFKLYSPNLLSIEVTREGKVRRAKIYYIRDRIGRAAKVKAKKII